MFLFQRLGKVQDYQRPTITVAATTTTVGLRTTIVRPGSQGNIDDAESRKEKTQNQISGVGLEMANWVVGRHKIYRSTVADLNVRVKCCRSSVRSLRHHA